MKCKIWKIYRQLGSYAAIFVAVILLLSPSSSYILCIAPDGHIEIENINAACCPSSDISIPLGYQSDDGFNVPGDCQNCIDFFIAAYGRDAALESNAYVASSPFADECLENRFSAEISLSPYRSSVIKNIDMPIPVSSYLPLLC